MAETAAHELGDVALGQQCISSNVLIGQLQRLEQGDGGFDLVGLFERLRIAFYGQEADFFWV
ncbi:MAG: hypothetical protein ACRES1_07155 [Steroidobacteraceae bacterium]